MTDIRALTAILQQLFTLRQSLEQVTQYMPRASAPSPQSGSRLKPSNPFEEIGEKAEKLSLKSNFDLLKDKLSSLFGFGESALATTEAANHAWNAGAMAAQNAAWNAAGLEASGLAPSAISEVAAEGGEIAATQGGMGLAGTLTSIAGALYGGYQLFNSWGKSSPTAGAIHGAALGAGIGGGLVATGALAGSWAGPIGLVAGGLIGGLLGFVRSGKHPDQKQRDRMRDALLEAGIVQSDWTIGLADGSRYDIGIDGGPKAEFGGRRPYELDLQDPLTQQMVGYFNPIVTVLTGGHKKLTSDFVGYFANAAMSNAGGDLEIARANAQAILVQTKMDPQTVAQGLVGLAQEGKIPQNDLAAYLNGIGSLFSTPLANAQGPAIVSA